MAEKRGQAFVSRDGDQITFNVAGLRRAAERGAAVLGTIADDVVTLGERAVKYGEGVLDRAEGRLRKNACPSCGTTMEKDTSGPGYTCPNCKATFTPAS